METCLYNPDTECWYLTLVHRRLAPPRSRFWKRCWYFAHGDVYQPTVRSRRSRESLSYTQVAILAEDSNKGCFVCMFQRQGNSPISICRIRLEEYLPFLVAEPIQNRFNSPHWVVHLDCSRVNGDVLVNHP